MQAQLSVKKICEGESLEQLCFFNVPQLFINEYIGK